jgi:integrase
MTTRRRKPVRVRVGKRKWEYPKGSGKWKEVWTITYYDRKGVNKQETPFPDNKRLTDLRADQMRKELMDGHHVAPSETVTVEVAAKRWHEQMRREGKKAGTLRQFSDCMENHIFPQFGKMLVADVRSVDVSDFVNELIDDDLARPARDVESILRRTLAMCIKREELVRNVLVDQPIDLGELEKPDIYIPTVEEAQAFFRALEHRHNSRDDYERHFAHANRKLMSLLAALEGLRRGEIQGLHWRNINPKTRMIEVRHGWCRIAGVTEPKTKAGKRDIPLDERVAKALSPIWDYWGEPDKDSMIMLTEQGGPAYGCMYESYHKTAMRHAHELAPHLGLMVQRADGRATDRQRDRGHTPKWGIHAWRHYAISSWILDDVPIPRVSKWAGHAHPGVTMKIYAKVIDSKERLAEDRERMEKSGTRLLGHGTLLDGLAEPKFLRIGDK